jgi:hypothetical protein
VDGADDADVVEEMPGGAAAAQPDDEDELPESDVSDEPEGQPSPSRPEAPQSGVSRPREPDSGEEARGAVRRRIEDSPQRDSRARDTGASLLEHWRWTDTTGAGVEILQRDAEASASHVTFFAERGLSKRKYKSNNKGSKNLTFHKCDETTQAGLLESRRTEWQKWKEFNAGTLVRGPELRRLLDQGHKPIPLQWVDVDKNEHMRRHGGQYVAPCYKSRLVSRGDLETGTEELRTDSPTADLEALNLLMSWAASSRLRLKGGDISNAYFQGKPLDRLLLLRPPPGGLQDPDVDADTMIVARVPIYGTKDAGRGFWRQLREDILATGLRENAIMKALYHMQVDGKIVFMLATHVDDMLWASAPGYEHIAERLLNRFSIKKVEEGKFRFCGREITQMDDGSITIRCKDNAEKVHPINYEKRGRKRFRRRERGRDISIEISRWFALLGCQTVPAGPVLSSLKTTVVVHTSSAERSFGGQ